MEDDDGDECAVEVAAFGDGDAAVRLEEGRKEGMDCFEVFVGNGKGEEGGMD